MKHQFVNHYMRGYLDGDGCLCIRKRHIKHQLRFNIVGNFSFLQKYQAVLETNCDINHNKVAKRNSISSLAYQGNIVVSKICEFLYNNSTFHLDRKYDIYKSLAVPINKSE
jgi:intein-encoded DNA endonuclease-like protein